VCHFGQPLTDTGVGGGQASSGRAMSVVALMVIHVTLAPQTARDE